MSRGSRPGERRGGRRKGTPNKRTVELFGALERSELITPKQVMLQAMRLYWNEGKITEAVECAAKVAPYEHPRLTALDAKIDQHTTHRFAGDYRAKLAAEIDRLAEAEEERIGEESASRPNGRGDH